MAVTLACLTLNHRCFDVTSLRAGSADSWCLLQDPRPGVHFKEALSAAVLFSEAETVFPIFFFRDDLCSRRAELFPQGAGKGSGSLSLQVAYGHLSYNYIALTALIELEEFAKLLLIE